MSIIICFVTFILSILFAALVNNYISTRIEERLGLSEKPVSAFLGFMPGIIKDFPIILILSVAVLIIISPSSDKALRALSALMFILITAIPYRNKTYGYTVIKAAGILSILITIVSALFLGEQREYNNAIHNPFAFISFLTAVISIPIFNSNTAESKVVNLARGIALNFILSSMFLGDKGVYMTALQALVLNSFEYLLASIFPRISIFHSMKYMLSIVVTSSLIGFTGNILWIIFFKGQAILSLLRI